MEYAKRRIFTDGSNKMKTALATGFALSTAKSPKLKIEDRPGFKNAVSKLAVKSNNLALDMLNEFEKRGLDSFSNKELISALNAIGSAWDRFTAPYKARDPMKMNTDNGKNPLRTIILQTVNTQEVKDVEIKDADFNESEEE
jgi:hypothetical protein